MKRGKKPTVAQVKLFEKAELDPNCWLIIAVYTKTKQYLIGKIDNPKIQMYLGYE